MGRRVTGSGPSRRMGCNNDLDPGALALLTLFNRSEQSYRFFFNNNFFSKTTVSGPLSRTDSYFV